MKKLHIMEIDNPVVASAIQQPEEVTPEEFDGVFRFTNATDEDFVGKWNGKEYIFPAQKTSPMIIPDETPAGVQSIRKKFARELAEREFYKTPKFGYMNSRERGEKPALYTDSDLEPFIQACLKPLPIAQAKVRVIANPAEQEKVFSRDEDGQPRTQVLKPKDSLVGNGTVVA